MWRGLIVWSFFLFLFYRGLQAGRDTTASCLSWMMHLLAQNPRVEAKVRQEMAEQLRYVASKSNDRKEVGARENVRERKRGREEEKREKTETDLDRQMDKQTDGQTDRQLEVVGDAVKDGATDYSMHCVDREDEGTGISFDAVKAANMPQVHALRFFWCAFGAMFYIIYSCAPKSGGDVCV